MERPEIEEPDAALIRDLLTAYRAELKRHRADERSYPSETFNPDRLYYGNAGRILQDRYADDREGLIAFCMETFKRGLIEHPLGYAHKVWRNLGRFYVVQDSRIYDRRMYHRMPAVLGGAKKSVTTAKEALSKHPTNRAYYEAIMAFPELPAQQPDGRVWFMGFRPVGEILSNGYRLFGNLNFPIQLALLVVICGLPRSRQHPICWIAVALSIYVLSANLTAASVHSLYTVRYIHANVSLVLFAQFAAMLFLLVSATHRPSSEEVDELPG
ncbi:MAG: hypothetical protein GY946_02095 [bacterium]|nr:hypothetical protein [bacterium]